MKSTTHELQLKLTAMSKKSILLFLFAATLFTTKQAHAQLRKIPAEVTNSFSEKFPDATNVEWRDQLIDFKVFFNEDDNKYVAKFSNQGEWKVTEQLIEIETLPKEVELGFSKSQYANWEIKEAAIIETPSSTTQYRIMVAKNNLNKKDLLFSNEGQLLKDNFTF